MKVLFVVNGAASSVTPRTRVVIQRALSRDHDVTAVETTRRGHATRLAQGAAAADTDVVIVMGGDGTLNEAANGLAGTSTALAALPGGSTNVFARTIGMTNDPIEATAELLDSLRDNNKRRIGLGTANGRYFLLNAGVGFDAAVVKRVEQKAFLKRYAGHLFFAWSTFLTWGTYNRRRTSTFSVKLDDFDPVNSYMTLIMNSDPYSYFGTVPLNVTPGVDFSAGLGVLNVRSLRLPTILGVVGSAMATGAYLNKSHQTVIRSDIKKCVITSNSKFPFQIDGDYLGDVNTLTVEHVADALDVFMPVE